MMSMSRSDFKHAFREVVSSEFAQIPSDENSIDFTFSDRFNRRMDKLIKAQKKFYWNLISTASKRVAVILVMMFTLFTAAFSVKAIREPLIKFIKQVYDSFTLFSFDGDTTDKIDKEYTVILPDSFEQTNKIQNDALIATEYTNSDGDIIEFKQMTTEYSIGYFVDNENGDIKTEIINDIEVEIKERYDTKSAIWVKDGYVFEIDCYGNIDWNTIKQIIESFK